MHKSFIFILVLLLACFSLATIPCTAETPQEFNVKAGYLLNIPKFVDWSPAAAGSSTFTIAVMGETPLNDILETLVKGKRIKNRPVAIITVHDIAEADGCQVLFIAASERYRLQRILPEAHRRGIMTISDMRDFAKFGGMVALVMANNRITYELNLIAAHSASISFSSQLLKLANNVIN